MVTDMEELLGLKFDTEEKIPGTFKSTKHEYRYLSNPKHMDFETLFDSVIDYVQPNLVADGSTIGIENCTITTPTGMLFQGIAYTIDMEGWRKQIAGGAKALGVQVAWIEDDYFCLPSNEKFLLTECDVQFL